MKMTNKNDIKQLQNNISKKIDVFITNVFYNILNDSFSMHPSIDSSEREEEEEEGWLIFVYFYFMYLFFSYFYDTFISRKF